MANTECRESLPIEKTLLVKAEFNFCDAFDAALDDYRPRPASVPPIRNGFKARAGVLSATSAR
jgi:hypothetical protein